MTSAADIGFDWNQEEQTYCVDYLEDTYQFEHVLKDWGEHLVGKWILLFYFASSVRFIIANSELEATFKFRILRKTLRKRDERQERGKCDERDEQSGNAKDVKSKFNDKQVSDLYVLKEIHVSADSAEI